MAQGILGKKVGMTRLFLEDGRSVPVTLIEAGPCTVVQRKTTANDGYEAVQVGFGTQKESRVTMPLLGHFKKAGVAPARALREFRVDAATELSVGDQVSADMFSVGQRVDITGTSKGKGFAGAMKRHGYGGGPAGHGSNLHRATGSVGQAAYPSEIYKGKGMPGHMGTDRVTVQNLEIIRVEAERNVIVVRGSVPGANGSLVSIKPTVKGNA
ncbi:MAG: 50S ribosomal protein L3 [Candidatus Hydrogenedentota bacterium]